MKILGERAVVTGAASGLGLALAKELSHRGAKLLLVDKDPAIRKVATTIPHARPVCGDVSLTRTWSRVAEILRNSGQQASILVNNAGICPGGPLEKLGLQVWEKAFSVNFRAALLGINTLLPPMLKRGQGAIVNIASIAGLMPFPLMGPYCASKAALISLSLALDMELRCRGIRVLAVAPGAIRTGILERNRIELPEKAGKIIRRALGLFGSKPEKIATIVADAIERDKHVLVLPGALRPLLQLYRLSPEKYLKLFSTLLEKQQKA